MVRFPVVAPSDVDARFDVAVWGALAAAVRRSRSTGAAALTPAHVLLALLERRGGPVRRLLRALEVDAGALRRRVNEVARPPGFPAASRSLFAVPSLIAAVAAAERERLLLGAPHVTATLLLAGLAAEGGEVAEALSAAGVSARLEALLADLGPLARPFLRERMEMGGRSRRSSLLDLLGRRSGRPDGTTRPVEARITALGPAAAAVAEDLATSEPPGRPPRDAAAILEALAGPGPGRPLPRVDNDHVLFDRLPYHGTGELWIHNGRSLDAVAVLATLAGRAVLAVSVRWGDIASMRRIPDGTYLLYFTMGLDWDPAQGQFADRSSDQRFVDQFGFRGSGTRSRMFRVTLHPVEDGNARIVDVPRSEFPRLG